jgi:hypothetical protein
VITVVHPAFAAAGVAARYTSADCPCLYEALREKRDRKNENFEPGQLIKLEAKKRMHEMWHRVAI